MRSGREALVVLVAVLLPVTGCEGLPGEAAILVNVRGAVSGPIASLHVVGTAIDGGWTRMADVLPWFDDTEIELPAEFPIELRSDHGNELDTQVDLCVWARDAAGNDVGSDCVLVQVMVGEVAEALIILAPPASSMDSGTDAAMMPGTDAGT